MLPKRSAGSGEKTTTAAASMHSIIASPLTLQHKDRSPRAGSSGQIYVQEALLQQLSVPVTHGQGRPSDWRVHLMLSMRLSPCL